MRSYHSLLPILLAVPVLGAAGQHAAFIGVVTDSASGAPITAAKVTLVEHDRHFETDEQGAFRLEGIASGEHTILVRQLGYEPWAIRLRVNVTEGMEIDLGRVRLTPQTVSLDPIEVEGEEYINSAGWAAFRGRMRTEKGTFFTAQDIRRSAPSRLSDFLRRVEGFRTSESGRMASTRGIPSISDGFSACAVSYYIDGVHAVMSSVDNILPAAVAGIEMYRGASSTPHMYRGIGNAKCGVVAIWTMDGVRRAQSER